ncbi:MAG: VOC family protein [Coriobacteriia bacterium]|nr:VOC family protein [Coriobacteriia bacterium]
MSDIIVWVDIPVVDLERARAFYSAVTGYPVGLLPGMGTPIGVIGGPDDGVSADLYEGGEPTHDGPTVYLGSGGDIDGMLARVVEAGGKILREKQLMGDVVGWVAFIEDTEGNRIGIQQPA